MKRRPFLRIMLASLLIPAWAAQAETKSNTTTGTTGATGTSSTTGTTGTTDTSAPTVVEEQKGTVRYDIYEIIDKNSDTVSFDAGKADLTEAEKKSLQDFVGKMQAEAPVEKFVVAAWADADYPAEGKELPRDARKLADERAKNVEKILKDAGARKVEAFEMTKHPNWLQKTFSTETAEVKGGARQDMWTNEVLMKVGEKLRSKGGPSKAVVVARFKGAVAAH